MDIKTYLEQKRQEVDRFLESIMPAEDAPPVTLHKAMRYSLFAGGKRVRPILAIAACEAICGASPLILPLASTLELIHTYSLIHDDLPAMDNDDYRRGRRTQPQGFRGAQGAPAGGALPPHSPPLARPPAIGDGPPTPPPAGGGPGTAPP